MKKGVLSFVLVIVCGICLNAQLRKIPAGVTDAFAARYPHAEKVEWGDKLTSFEAGFILNGVNMKAGFSSNGAWKYCEKTISFGDLSPDVKDGLAKSKYSDWKTGSVVEIQQAGKELQYRLFAEKSSPFQKKFLYFGANGKLLRDAITF